MKMLASEAFLYKKASDWEKPGHQWSASTFQTMENGPKIVNVGVKKTEDKNFLVAV